MNSGSCSQISSSCTCPIPSVPMYSTRAFVILSVLACIAGGIVSKFCHHRDQFALGGKINVSFEELKRKDTFFLHEWLKQKGLLKPCEIFES